VRAGVVGRPRAWRVEEFAELLDVGRTRVYELLRSGGLRSVKIGGSRRVPSTVVRAYVDWLLSPGHRG
jgi:excisionase family DNA binding protein